MTILEYLQSKGVELPLGKFLSVKEGAYNNLIEILSETEMPVEPLDENELHRLGRDYFPYGGFNFINLICQRFGTPKQTVKDELESCTLELKNQGGQIYKFEK